jgi:hypothetical protein
MYIDQTVKMDKPNSEDTEKAESACEQVLHTPEKMSLLLWVMQGEQKPANFRQDKRLQ